MDPWCNDSQVVEESSGIAHPTTNNTNFFQDNFKVSIKVFFTFFVVFAIN